MGHCFHHQGWSYAPSVDDRFGSKTRSYPRILSTRSILLRSERRAREIIQLAPRPGDDQKLAFRSRPVRRRQRDSNRMDSRGDFHAALNEIIRPKIIVLESLSWRDFMTRKLRKSRYGAASHQDRKASPRLRKATPPLGTILEALLRELDMK